ncbi:hypothetical protein AGMMS50296_6420 [Alphaproteobacteria bacterium]|nr:hypothetical protein AGMMS50296_6420 [Alphaproteobacteria bacterium]
MGAQEKRKNTNEKGDGVVFLAVLVLDHWSMMSEQEYSHWKEALGGKFYTGTSERQRQFVSKSIRVK